ncbi:MAG: hypothetical protein V3S29_05970, partial [bacterium]
MVEVPIAYGPSDAIGGKISQADSTGAGAPRVLLLKPANEWAIERETARGNTAGAPVYRNGGSRSLIGGATEMRTNDLR